MPKIVKTLAVLVIVGILCAGAVFFFKDDLMDFRRTDPKASLEQGTEGEPSKAMNMEQSGKGLTTSSLEEPKIPEVPGATSSDGSGPGEAPPAERPQDPALRGQLPPSPPLPVVSMESTQSERREAFQLKHSIDHIVLKDEPFEVDGKQWTIAEIQRQLTGKPGEEEMRQLIPSIQERDIGGPLRKPVFSKKNPEAAPPVYFGVRVVRPGECVWKIHFRLLQEYLARRQIILRVGADEPLSDGRSSGVGRLLKFLEGVVLVYNLGQNRLEKDLNFIHPVSVIAFFKISDLMAALDQLRPDDIQWLRYVNNRLRLEGPREGKDLLDRKDMMQ